jgi:hypothetical protein
MRKAVMLLPYMGPLPHWMDLFLLTASRNPSFRFVLYTDQPFDHFPQYENVDWRPTKLGDIRDRFIDRTGLTIPNLERAYKLCDFKPTYGDLFSEEIKEPFWGFGDIDMLWGRLDQFMTPDVFENDVISGDPNRLCGPFTLFRNTPEITTLYRSAPGFERAFMDTLNIHTFDEKGMSDFVIGQPALRLALNAGRHGWPGRKARYLYRDGRMIRKWRLKDLKYGNFLPRETEIAFFHLHSWKHFSYDFDPSRVRGWTLNADRFIPIA